MTGNEYQKLAARTMNIERDDFDKERHSLFGMASEIGELHSLYQRFTRGTSSIWITRRKNSVTFFGSSLSGAPRTSLTLKRSWS